MVFLGTKLPKEHSLVHKTATVRNSEQHSDCFFYHFNNVPLDDRTVFFTIWMLFKAGQLPNRLQSSLKHCFQTFFLVYGWKIIEKQLKSTKIFENGQKSILTSFHVRAAPKSWSKYTTTKVNISLTLLYLMLSHSCHTITPQTPLICVTSFMNDPLPGVCSGLYLGASVCRWINTEKRSESWIKREQCEFLFAQFEVRR